MNAVRSVVALLLATSAISGCSWVTNRDVDNCGKYAARKDLPFDSTSAGTLAGRYQLIMISESSNEYSHSVRGPLELFPLSAGGAPSSSRLGSSLLWGATTLPKGITIPWTYDPSSRDQSKPGLLVHSSGDVELGGPAVAMHIESVRPDGFDGTWTSVPNSTLPVDANNNPLPAPHGRFCALRRS